MLAYLLAHQVTWDSMALVFVPLVLFAAILVMANRRAGAHSRRANTDPPPGEEPSPPR